MIILLIVGFHRVDLPNLPRLVTNSDYMRTYGAQLFHPDWSHWRLYVGQMWLTVGIGALLFRTVQLFFIKGVQTGLVWLTKIITDPFNDILTYRKAPLYLLRGELIDPMAHAHRA